MSAATVSRYYATGRRKNSIARVWMMPGSGKVTINDRPMDQYFGRDVLKMIIRQPFEVTGTVDKFDVLVSVLGGGNSGQAGAIRHGISKALLAVDAESRGKLRKEGLLTRDPRAKERKKYGQKGCARPVPVLQEIRDHIPICVLVVLQALFSQREGRDAFPFILLFCFRQSPWFFGIMLCSAFGIIIASSAVGNSDRGCSSMIMTSPNVKIAIVGSSGYTGGELYRLLLHHHFAIGHRSNVGKIRGPADHVYFPASRGLTDLVCEPLDPTAIAKRLILFFWRFPTLQPRRPPSVLHSSAKRLWTSPPTTGSPTRRCTRSGTSTATSIPNF